MLGCGSRALQIGGNDHIGSKQGEGSGSTLGLSEPRVVQGDIDLPLETMFGIPHGLTVSPEDNPTTHVSSNFSIGQSFHSRSIP